MKRSIWPDFAYLLWARFNEVRSDGADARRDAEEPPDASDHSVQDMLPAVHIVIGSAESIGNALWRQTIQPVFFKITKWSLIIVS